MNAEIIFELRVVIVSLFVVNALSIIFYEIAGVIKRCPESMWLCPPVKHYEETTRPIEIMILVIKNTPQDQKIKPLFTR